MKILILCALPQEYAPLKNLLPGWKKIQRSPFPKWFLHFDDKDIFLLETGMGGRLVLEAIKAELLSDKPALVMFAGFAGGLHPSLQVGDVCFVHRTRLVSSQKNFEFHLPGEMYKLLRGKNVSPVWAFTSHEFGDKPALSALARDEMAVVDMETAVMAEAALAEKLPALCLRAISDGVGDELGFDLGDLAGTNGKIKPVRVIKTVITRPGTLRSFYLSWERSRKAAQNLCKVLAELLRLPSAEFESIAAKIRIGTD
jgi:hypothetical protein